MFVVCVCVCVFKDVCLYVCCFVVEFFLYAHLIFIYFRNLQKYYVRVRRNVSYHTQKQRPCNETSLIGATVYFSDSTTRRFETEGAGV